VPSSCVPDGAAISSPGPDEPIPKTTTSLLATVTDGEVLEAEAAMTSTGVL
jgi:hypothetical protein